MNQRVFRRRRALRLLLPAALLSALATPAPGDTPNSPLPVTRVTLFTSGVAYTERTGQVDGVGSVPLMFRTAQINDILKSMVLIDRGGTVMPATYASRDPISRTLQGFSVDVSSDLSQAELLGKLRGSQVSVESSGKAPLMGQIVGVEQRAVPGPDGKPIAASFLNLLTEGGLTAVRIDTDRFIRILDPRVNAELQQALSTLAGGMDTQRRQVMLHFSGVGKRSVRVAYVMESPIWKISYRLVLDNLSQTAGKPKPYLQGWALVENTTDEDWKGVKLTLVSGRPVSFIQDLYQPLYVPRPEVGPDLVASPFPQTHGDNLMAEERKPADNPVASAPAGPGSPGSGGPGGGQAGERQDKNVPADHSNSRAFRKRAALLKGEAARSDAGGGLGDISGAVQAQATGQKAGEMFQYSIKTPINLPRLQAAMIPVIAQDIAADKVSLFNAETDEKYPMNAVRIHNGAALHLKGGPITLFDGGAYAGDATMEDVPPNDSRLITYAVDLSLICHRDESDSRSLNTSISIRHGVIIETRQEESETVYTVKSRSDKPKNLLVEHPYDAEWKLVTPTAALERTEDLYRFAVSVPAGASRTLKVVTRRPVSSRAAISDTSSDNLMLYISGKSMSPALKSALADVVRRRRAINDLKARAGALTAEIAGIGTDQERIRKNMGALDHSSQLYRRYAGELDRQETRIEALRRDSLELLHQAEAAKRKMNEFVNTISG